MRVEKRKISCNLRKPGSKIGNEMKNHDSVENVSAFLLKEIEAKNNPIQIHQFPNNRRKKGKFGKFIEREIFFNLTFLLRKRLKGFE